MATITHHYRMGELAMQLTDEQIEAAAKAMEDAYFSHAAMFNHRVPRVCKETTDMFCGLARAAAPFLQMPLERPTHEDIMASCSAFNQAENRSSTYLGIPQNAMMNALHEFVARRNAALLPKPVDPRIDKVEALLVSRNPTMLMPREMARQIIAALDAKD